MRIPENRQFITQLDNEPSRFRFFGSSGLLMIALLIVGILFSLFRHEVLADSDLTNDRVIMPVMENEIPDVVKPPTVKPQPQTAQPKSPANPAQQPVAVAPPPKGPAQSIDPNVPISTAPPEKPGSFFPGAEPGPVNNPGSRNTGGTDVGGDGLNPSGSAPTGAEPAEEQPPPPKPVTPAPVKPKVISLGPVTGMAKVLPKPPYPAPARMIRAGGPVNVSVLIDEDGNVVSAKAVSGHPLLRQVAENAARMAKFSPTTLGGQPVKVSGTITYNFIP